MTIDATASRCRCRGVVHRRLAIFRRLSGVTGSAIKFGLVDTMAGSTDRGINLGRLVVSLCQRHCVQAGGMAGETLAGCHQLVKGLAGVARSTVLVLEIIRSMVHGDITGLGLGLVTDCAVKGVTTDTVDPRMAGGARRTGISRCGVVKIGDRRFARSLMTKGTVVLGGNSASMASSAVLSNKISRFVMMHG